MDDDDFLSRIMDVEKVIPDHVHIDDGGWYMGHCTICGIELG